MPNGSPVLIHRRALMAGAGALALAPVAGCTRERPPSRSASLIAGDSCPVTPRQTDGPFYFDPELVRQDLAEGRPGVPLQLRLQIVDATGCAPAERARVDVWHCDAGGAYSGYDRERTSGETFLRGTQIADARGVAAFRTLYPGWYEGRAPHVHVKAWTAHGRELTSQIYFPDALSDLVYAQGPYGLRGGLRLRNGDDGLFRSAGPAAPIAHIAEAGNGYDAAIVIALT